MREPTVSIIVPAYNAGDYLAECVGSILAQTSDDWELILIDDGSTDNTAAMCRDYAASMPGKVRTLRVDRVGLSSARNTGIRMANGRYISFVDADDKLFPQFLEKMTALMRSEHGCGIAVAQFTQSEHPVGKTPHTAVYQPEEAILHTLYQEPTFLSSAWAKLYSRDIFETETFADGRYYEDLEFFPRAYLKAGKIAISDEALYYYRPNPASFINTWSDSRPDALWAVDSIMAMPVARTGPISKAALSRAFSAYFNFFLLATAYRKPELADRCWKFITANRRDILADRHVRMKNKIGALLSYFGRRLTEKFANNSSR